MEKMKRRARVKLIKAKGQYATGTIVGLGLNRAWVQWDNKPNGEPETVPYKSLEVVKP